MADGKPHRGTKHAPPSKGRSRREEVKIAARRVEVIARWRKGETQQAIADSLNVNRNTIWRDILAVLAEWKEVRVTEHEQLVLVELDKLGLIENEAWDAWERSKRPAETTKITKEGSESGGVMSESAVKVEKTSRGQAGDASFLAIIERCSESRRKLQGIDAPTKIAPTTPDGAKPYAGKLSDMSDDELMTLKRLRDRTNADAR